MPLLSKQTNEQKPGQNSRHGYRFQKASDIRQSLRNQNETTLVEGRQHALPSHKLYDARRIIRGACDMCADLVQDPLNRLEEMSHGALSLMECLYILVAAGIPDILDEVDSREGMSIDDLSKRTKINSRKLGASFIS